MKEGTLLRRTAESAAEHGQQLATFVRKTEPNRDILEPPECIVVQIGLAQEIWHEDHWQKVPVPQPEMPKEKLRKYYNDGNRRRERKSVMEEHRIKMLARGLKRRGAVR